MGTSFYLTAHRQSTHLAWTKFDASLTRPPGILTALAETQSDDAFVVESAVQLLEKALNLYCPLSTLLQMSSHNNRGVNPVLKAPGQYYPLNY